MRVREIMTENPLICTTETSLQEVAQMMVECDCGAIPVVEPMDSGQPVGIITDRDITVRIVAEGKNPEQMRARDAMSQPVLRIAADEDIDTLSRLMEKNQVRRVVVLDGDRQIVGMVAQADLARALPEARAGEVVEHISQPGNRSRQG
jgi:CBS domain-containing protein